MTMFETQDQSAWDQVVAIPQQRSEPDPGPDLRPDPGPAPRPMRAGGETRFVLPDRRVAHLRRLQRGCTDVITEVFEAMSPQSRFLRFHSGTPALGAKVLRYLAHTTPGQHEAVFASVDGRAVGIARWVRLADREHTAELAVAVGDEFQGKGLGRVLVSALAHLAHDAGIDRFTAVIHPENRSALAMLSEAGARPSLGELHELQIAVGALLATWVAHTAE